jgi:hypothetical protein
MPFASPSHRSARLLPGALVGAFLFLLLGAGGAALYAVSLSTPAAPAEPAVPAPGRCVYCGWIESKREVLPQLYEYTARMGDGTTRVFREPLPTSWRLGERILVIDGAGKPDRKDQRE